MTFGVVNNLRITKNQKIRYLTILKQFFESLGYEKIDILKSKIVKKTSFFTIIGDSEEAEFIVATYYDTPVMSILRKRYEPFNDEMRKKQNSTNYILSMIFLGMVLFLFNYFVALPVYQNGSFGVRTVIVGFLSLLLLTLIIKLSRMGGFPSFGNLIRNTSSVVAMLKFANSLSPKERKKVAFVFVDYGCEDYLGYYALSTSLNQSRKQKLIFLDCVGAGNIQKSKTKSSVLTAYFDHPLFVFGEFKKESKDYEAGIDACLSLLNKETFKKSKLVPD